MSSNNCILNLLKVIDLLQRNSISSKSLENGCNRPFLGPSMNLSCYNTRPISLYTRDGNLFTYANTTFFRVEAVDDCSVVLRRLIKTNDLYTATNDFVTISANCFCVIRCFPDTSITCL